VSLDIPSVSAWFTAWAVDGEVGGQAHATIGPRRFRIPLLGEHVPNREREIVGLECESRGAAQLFGERATEDVRDVGFAAFKHGEPHGLVRDRPEHERLH